MAGCVETIVMDSGEEDLPVVVNCVLDFEESGYTLKPGGGRGISLTLQYVKGKTDPEFVPVEDAVVYLERPAEVVPWLNRINFVHTEGCTWEADESMITAKVYPNERYILNVEIPGRERIWAETMTIPDVGITLPDEGADEMIRSIQIKGFTKNCCMWAFGIEDRETGRRWDEKPMDYLVTDYPYIDPLNFTGLHYSDLSFQGTPTDYSGLTALKAFDLAKEMLADMPLYEGFIHIEDLSYDKPFIFFPGPLFPPGASLIGPGFSIPYYTWVVCYFVSSDLDKYIRSVYVHNKSRDSNLASVYSQANDIYTNIHGGLGVFGSRRAVTYPYISPLYMDTRYWTE